VDFPRSHERGPVEASTTPARTTAARGPFRALTSAAPLKPTCHSPPKEKPARFPRSHERGPVEASSPWPTRTKWLCFPRSHERGPVEAARAGIPREDLRDLSALSRARPR